MAQAHELMASPGDPLDAVLAHPAGAYTQGSKRHGSSRAGCCG
jgi:hypothetical protein